MSRSVEDIAKVIEAVLFAAEKPVSLARLKQLIPHAKNGELQEALSSLEQHYRDHAFTLAKIAGGDQLLTRAEDHDYVKRLFATRARPRLSQAALETLAVIAYKQPVSRIEIEAIRGVNSDGVLGTLLERNLITIKGRAETVGRPLLYGTTEEFLRYFGLNDLSELPKPEEIEQMLRAREEMQEENEESESEEHSNDNAS